MSLVPSPKIFDGRKEKLNQIWLQKFVTLVLRRQRQEACYKFSLDYTDNPPAPIEGAPKKMAQWTKILIA